jgi:hypothetical protein
MKKILIVMSMTFSLVITLIAQSGGGFSIPQSVISNGGARATNGPFEITGTVGQIVTATSSGANFEARSGFWQQTFVPTAAGVTVAGHVRTHDGRGLSGAIVMLTKSDGTIVSTRSASFGAFRFDGLAAGETVTIAVVSRRFQFPTRVIALADSIDGLELTAFGETP